VLSLKKREKKEKAESEGGREGVYNFRPTAA
jgi:hypothetical protein